MLRLLAEITRIFIRLGARHVIAFSMESVALSLMVTLVGVVRKPIHEMAEQLIGSAGVWCRDRLTGAAKDVVSRHQRKTTLLQGLDVSSCRRGARMRQIAFDKTSYIV